MTLPFPNTWMPLLLAACLAGCSGAQGQTGEAAPDADVSVDTPPIHVSQTLVHTKHGEVTEEAGYHEALANCAKVSVPTRPLPANVVPKLGRDYYEVWYQGNRIAIREDDWRLAIHNLCEFSPVHTSTLWLIGPNGTDVIDLDTRQGHVNPSVFVRRSARKPQTAADTQLQAAVAAELQRHGRGSVLGRAGGQRVVAGQPCVESSDALGESCTWSGGEAWGFSEQGTGSPLGILHRVDSIILSASELKGDEHLELTTQRMTVGERFDPGVFARPAGIAMTGAP